MVEPQTLSERKDLNWFQPHNKILVTFSTSKYDKVVVKDEDGASVPFYQELD